MSFFDRYAKACMDHGIEPCSQRAADMFGTTRATISQWNTRQATPKGDTVAVIASALNVSSEYLLGRTDDPIDPVSYLRTPAQDSVYLSYAKLDVIDQAKVEAYIDALLTSEKYNPIKKENRA